MKIRVLWSAVLALFVTACSVRPPEPVRGCDYWRSKVDDSVALQGTSWELPANDEALGAIECLITMEGRITQGRFGGAMRWDVTPECWTSTADVAALYYISYIYTSDEDHAHVVCLNGPDGPNTGETVRKAFEAYRRWLAEVRTIGLDEARKKQLSPLSNSEVAWQGNHR